MNQNEQLTSKAIEMQRTTLENSQEALEQAMELPVEQTLEFQKRAAELFLNGLEMGSWAQDQGVELTRDAFSTYIDTMENAVRDTTALAETQLQQATDAGHQSMTPPSHPQPGPADSMSQPQQPPATPPQQAPGQNFDGPASGGVPPAPNQYQPPAPQPSQTYQSPAPQPPQTSQPYANPPATEPIGQPQQIQPIQQTPPVPQQTQPEAPPRETPVPQESPRQQTQTRQSTTETESETAESPPERS